MNKKLLFQSLDVERVKAVAESPDTAEKPSKDPNKVPIWQEAVEYPEKALNKQTESISIYINIFVIILSQKFT